MPSYLRHPRFLRAALAWSLGLGAILAVILIPLLLQDERHRIEAIAAREGQVLLTAENAIQAMLRERLSATHVLVRSPSVGAYLDHPDEFARARLSKLLTVFCAAYGRDYDPLRVVGLDGATRIRVDRRDGHGAEAPEVAEPDPAVRSALRRKPFDIDVLALGRQRGPGARGEAAGPILRFQSLLADDAGAARVLLVLDYDARDFLERILGQGDNHPLVPSDSHLLDEQGHSLYSTGSPGDFPAASAPDRFESVNPGVWRALRNGRDQLRTREGLYLLRTLHTPMADPVTAGAGQAWHLVRFIPNASLLATSPLHNPVGWIGLVCLCLLVLLFGGMVAVVRIKQEERAALEGARAALLAAPFGILVVDDRGIITLANREAIRLFGYADGSLAGQTVAACVPGSAPGSCPESKGPGWDFPAGERGAGREWRAFRKDGTPFWVTLDWNILEQPRHSRQRLLICAIHDVTERCRAIREERDGAQRLQLAVDASGLGLWEWNVKTNRIRWDARMFAIYGVRPTPDGFVDYRDWSGAVRPEKLAEQERPRIPYPAPRRWRRTRDRSGGNRVAGCGKPGRMGRGNEPGRDRAGTGRTGAARERGTLSHAVQPIGRRDTHHGSRWPRSGRQ